MELHEFLLTHPLLSISSIEKVCGIPHGTLRKGKSIPVKYINEVTNILKEYGFNSITNCDTITKRDTIIKPSITNCESVNNVYDVRFMPNNHKDKIMQIGTWANKEHTLFRTENLEVGDKVIIKHQKDNNIT